ncbi:MAG: GTPase ObgE [Verrucomicrobiota bacterium]
MFYDQIRVSLRAGNGGHGCASFRRAKYVPKGGPDGGDGGNGGDLILRSDRNVSDLRTYRFRPQWKAKSGESGKGSQKNGKNGESVVLIVPIGTEVVNERGKTVCELLEDGVEVTLLRGGKGGLGNIHFKTATNQAPREFTEGKPGQAGDFVFSLKTIADVGLIGFPNAGKSTLLSRLTNASPKSAPYPFTTVDPSVGMTEENENFGFQKITIADIPGLIEGAADNRGLGHRFLRHVERCRILLVVLDSGGSDGRDPLEDFQVLQKELELYRKDMVAKPMMVAANKMDLPAATENVERLKEAVDLPVFPICAELGEGLEPLLEALYEACGV